MKITNKQLIPGVLVAAAIVCGGTYLTISNMNSQNSPFVFAYTSAENAQDPATAPASYVVTVPDAKLKEALNDIIAKAMNAARKQQGLPEDVVRTPDQAITAGDMKFPVNMYGPLGLNSKGITNLEGVQFLVNATRIDIVGNQITNAAPLRDLPKAAEINLSRNPIADVTPLASMPNLTKLIIGSTTTLKNIAPLASAPKLKELQIPSTGVSNLAPLASISTLEILHINNMNIGTAKLDLSPLATLPNLQLVNANTNRLTGADFAVLKNAPKLETLMTAGNNVLNLNDMLKDGFAPLQRWSTFSDQVHAINTGANAVFANPVRGIANEVIPVQETANVKNADADGTLNPNGEYIKLVDVYGPGNVAVRWEKDFTKNQVTNRPFSGTITVTYNLPPKDTTKPVFSPEAPAKIVSRKGVAINITDVTATDAGSGLNAAGVTNNATAINLNPTNPAAGNYTLRYSATDNTNNTATVDREIEITDADALQAKVTATTDASLDGYTTDSKKAVTDKKAAAEAIIAKNDATQAQIDQALVELEQTLANLQVDTRKLEAAVGKYNAEPKHIQEDPAVQTALAEANHVLNDPAKTPASVDKAARDLIKALEDATQAESDRQTAATDALNEIEGEDKKAARTPSAIQAVKDKINAVKDEGIQDSLLRELKAVEDAYAAKKDALQKLIAKAKDPATVAGSSAATIAQLQATIQVAETVDNNADASQGVIESTISSLQLAIDSLRPDKSALETLINSVPSESDFVKNDPEVVAKLAAANDVKNKSDATPDQIKQAKEALEKAINDAKAAEAEQQAEARRQADAAQAVAQAEAVKTPTQMDDAQAKIDAVKDDAKKQELQAKLDAVRSAYNTKKDELKKLIDRANEPTLLDGMTIDTANEVRAERKDAKERVYDNNGIDQASIEDAIQHLQAALDGLRADKKPLADAEATHNEQPDYIKNNPAVAAAFRKAQGTRAMANPPVQQVKDDAKALEDAIKSAVKTETDAQSTADTSLNKAEAEVSNPVIGENGLPAVDIDAIQAEIDAIQDPTAKADAQSRLDAVKQAIETKKSKIAADKLAQAEQKAKEKIEKQRAEKAGIKSPSTGIAKQESPIVAIIASALAIVSLPITLLAKKRK